LIKVFSVVWVSGSGSYTFTISHISADNISTVVVVPEVVGGDWSPVSISTSSIDPTFSGVSEFFTSLLPSSYPWFTRAFDMSLSALVVVVWSTMLSALEDGGVSRRASSVSCLTVEVFSIVVVSGSGSYTFTESHISANNGSTIVVIPEVV
jgi:hypothetical protein